MPMQEIEDDFGNFVESLANNEPILVKCVTNKWRLQASSILNPKDTLRITMVPVDGVEDHNRITMELGDFLELAAQKCKEKKVLYCKDWHIDRCPELKYHYMVPECFQDDWLNWYWHSVCTQEFPDADRDDYSFCYVGTPGSSTGFHHDVCYSYSWSVNLQGIKRWRLWPDEGQKGTGDKCIEVLQRPGDAIFVPSGCNHEVENLSDGEDPSGTNADLVISVNRNWFNGFNICKVFRFIKTEHDKVCAELIDLYPQEEEPTALTTKRSHIKQMSVPRIFQNAPPPRMTSDEWHRHCDVLLLANAAMNWTSFLCLITARILLMASLTLTPSLSTETTDESSAQQSLSRALATFCSRYRPVKQKKESEEDLEELFQLQRNLYLPGSRGITVWNHTLSELITVISAMRDDHALLTAFTYVFNQPLAHLEAAIGELIYVCERLSTL